MTAHRPGAFERLAWTPSDADYAKAKQADSRSRMLAVLNELELTDVTCRIAGLARNRAAAILRQRIAAMVALVRLLLIGAAPFVLGYRLVAVAVSVRAANGVLLLVLAAAMALWVLSNMTFDAGFCHVRALRSPAVSADRGLPLPDGVGQVGHPG